MYKQGVAKILTMSVRAHDNLFTLMSRQSARQTMARRMIQAREYNGIRIQDHTRDMNMTHDDRREGASWGLTLLARNYDYKEWTDTRKHNWWYDPVDQAYIDASNEDPTEFDDLPAWEQQARLDMYLDERLRFELQMTDYTCMYYAGLAKFFEMKPVSTMRNDATWCGTCLEAIGSYYLTPPEGYSGLIEESPNYKKYRKELATSPIHKLYGNHGHQPYLPKDWKPLLHGPEDFIQEDVDYCMTHNLQDLAKEAVLLNPKLVIKKAGIE